MGYTHYWKHNGFTDDQWKMLVENSNDIISKSNCKIANAFGECGTNPVLNNNCISLNGEGDESCETFYITKNAQSFEFCKTRRLPYDNVVVAIMKTAQNINSSFEPSSDGYSVF